METVAVKVDPNANKKYEGARAKEKCLILDGVKDHVIPPFAEKNTTREIVSQRLEHNGLEFRCIT